MKTRKSLQDVKKEGEKKNEMKVEVTREAGGLTAKRRMAID